MGRRIIASVCVCAAIVFACAPRNALVGSDDDAKASAPPTEVRPLEGVGLGATVVRVSDGDATRFRFVVTNYGETAEVRFASGLTHDFIVLDEREREVWRWSADRLFTQTLQTKQLRTGDTMRFEATWRDAKPGTYQIVAVLNSETDPVRVAEQFVVR